MSVTTHVYAAMLQGAPATALSVRGGSITLDEARAPHVEAQLTIAVPPIATLVALDPRTSPSRRVTVTANGRSFDLALRARKVSHALGVVTLTLASDEALLADYSPQSDVTLIQYAHDLRALAEVVVRMVLGPSVTIAGPTANRTPYWDATNLLLNPSVEVDAGNWGAGGGASALTRLGGTAYVGAACLRWTAAAGTSDVFPTAGITAIAATPGKPYSFGVYLHSSISRTARAVLRFYDQWGGLLQETQGAAVVTATNAWKRLTVEGVEAPSRAAFVFPFITTAGNTSGQFHYADAAVLSQSLFLPDYIDGSLAATAQYTYGWASTPHASSSYRRALLDTAAPEAFVWKAGQSALAFLAALLQAAELRLVCDETRAWTTRDGDYSASGAIAIRHAVNLIDADDELSREESTWFDMAVTSHVWTDPDGVQQTRVDAFALTPAYTQARLFEKTTPYPGPGFSEYAVRRAQGRGREVSATTVSDWRARAEQPISIVLEGAPIQTGRTSRVVFDLDTDEMTVTTRTTDTPPSAWELIPTGERWIDSPAGASWISEAV